MNVYSDQCPGQPDMSVSMEVLMWTVLGRVFFFVLIYSLIFMYANVTVYNACTHLFALMDTYV